MPGGLQAFQVTCWQDASPLIGTPLSRGTGLLAQPSRALLYRHDARLEISGLRGRCPAPASSRSSESPPDRSQWSRLAGLDCSRRIRPSHLFPSTQRRDMNLDEINDLHERAMNVAEAAVIARTEGDLATSCERFQEALELATEAAAEIAPYVQEEPMRSVFASQRRLAGLELRGVSSGRKTARCRLGR